MADDERPRPQFGEYATPEEVQRAYGKRPIPPLRPQPEPPHPPGPPHPPLNQDPLRPPPADGPVRVHLVDRFATYILLGIGVYQLLAGLFSYFDFGSTLESTAKTISGTAYTAPATAAALGYLVFGFNVVLFGLTVWWSFRRFARGKVAFWVPILGYIVFVTIVAILIAWLAPSYVAVMQRYVINGS